MTPSFSTRLFALELLSSCASSTTAPAPRATSGAEARSSATTSVARTASDTARGSLEWRGGPTAILERAGLRLLTDPVLGPRSKNAFVLPKHPSTGVLDAPVARYTDPPANPIGRVDLIVLSHNHADHFDATAKQTLPKDVLFVLPPGAAAAVSSYGFTNLRPLDWNEETQVTIGEAQLRITAVPARHAHDPAIDASVGKGNGYVLTWERPAPYSVYWTGDAVFSPEMRETAIRFARVDLWLPHLGAVGVDGAAGLRTLDAEEAVQAMTLLQPRRTIPIHHTTFGHYREPVAAFVQRATANGMVAGITLPIEGQAIALDR
jgi:L-ascorbate metabolism protein UlaG (beta-lactamase superfamily)